MISSLEIKKGLIYLTFLSVLLVSCQMQEVEVGVPAPDIKATVEADPATKTQLSVDWEGTGVISWIPADKINVFFGKTGAQYTSQNTLNATTAVFRTSDSIGIEEISSNNIWGLYPYNSSATCTGSAVMTTLPAVQAGVPETFDDDLYITLAHSNSTDLQFYNVCSGIKFSLSRDDIKSVSFRGNNNENLAGDISLTFENDRPKAAVLKGVKEITLTPKSGDTFEKDVNYYIVTLPVTLSKGFTITFTPVNGPIGTFTYTDKSVTLERSVFSRKNQLESYATFIDESHEAVDLGLSVMWASCNVGASSPEEYGDYFAWGETEKKSEYDLTNYRFRVTGDSYSSITLSKYNTTSRYGTIDNKTQLELSDDAARANWGDKWRIPTYAEWMELRYNCIWTWATQNGVNGYRVTSKKNSNSIFLPATGCRVGTSLYFEVINGTYWSSTLSTDYPYRACYVVFDRVGVSWSNYYRDRGQSVRPVFSEFVEVLSISLDKTSEDLNVGESITLTATIQPSNATAKDVIWSSSDTDIASVSTSGVVTANAAGTATITAYASNGLSSSCTVTVKNEMPVAEAIDLGLSVKWASYNVGASKPEDYGDYFAWGETDQKDVYSVSNYKWCNASETSLIKYNTNIDYGAVDNRTQLDLSDDAAHVNWGGKWRIPTEAECGELRKNCIWILTTQNGVYGLKVTSSINGNSIFLPAAGAGGSSYTVGSRGNYWSSTLNRDSDKRYAYDVFFNSSDYGVGCITRFYGFSVRPVYGEFVEVSSISLDKTSTNLIVGESITLTATIQPGNATAKDVTWSSSNRYIAYVSDGVITAEGVGSATITAYASNGLSASCTVTVTEPATGMENGYEWVNLGLSVKWASYNVGASKPEEYGYYFAWGETSPKSDYLYATYKWCNGSYTTLTKYNTRSSYGTVDNKTQLELADDAARANWGGKWRMPTDAELTELRLNCTCTWTTRNGVKGYNVTSKINGNSIFLPAAGNRNGTTLYSAGSGGNYWSSTLFTDYPYDVYHVEFDSSKVYRDAWSRHYGLSVRPVTE